MWNAEEKRGGAVAVAVCKEKSSQYAFKWAIENRLLTDKPLKLVHVVQRPSPSPPHPLNSEDSTLIHEEIDALPTDVFLPYRCFCSRRRVQFETVMLHDSNVARALINFVSVNGVETLLLGSKRKCISRMFKNSNVPRKVLKWTPDYCRIYIISKGRVSAMRPASRSAPKIVPATQTTNTLNSEPVPEMLHEELSLAENDNYSVGEPERVSTDSNYLSFYENLGLGFTSASVKSSHSDHTFMEDEINPIGSNKHVSSTETSSPYTQLNVEDDEVRRLKIELKQIMDMYQKACQEAPASKQRTELEEYWETEQERRMKDVKAEAIMAESEREEATCKEAEGAAHSLAEQEVEQTLLRAMMEVEEKHKAMDVLGCSHHLVLKYHGLFHILIIVFFIVFLLFFI